MISEEQCQDILDRLSDINTTAVLSKGPLSDLAEGSEQNTLPDGFDSYNIPEKIWAYLKLSAYAANGAHYALQAQNLADTLIRNMDVLSADEAAVFAAGLVLLDSKYTPQFLRHIYLQYARIAVSNTYRNIDVLSDTGKCFLKMAACDLLKARSVYKW